MLTPDELMRPLSATEAAELVRSLDQFPAQRDAVRRLIFERDTMRREAEAIERAIEQASERTNQQVAAIRKSIAGTITKLQGTHNDEERADGV